SFSCAHSWSIGEKAGTESTKLSRLSSSRCCKNIGISIRPIPSSPAMLSAGMASNSVRPTTIFNTGNKDMDQRKEPDKYDSGDFRFFDKEPPFWPRVIGIGIMLVIAVLMVAYGTYQVLSI